MSTTMRLSEIQRDLIVALFAGCKVERLYGGGGHVWYYSNGQQVAERTVQSLEHRRLIKRGAIEKRGIGGSCTQYELTDLGREIAAAS